MNPQLNAVVHVSADSAREQALEADRALANGQILEPLHGVPITFKDSFDTAGVVTIWGTPGQAEHIPSSDATVVARMKAAGAIPVGKTNTPELILSFVTDNPIHGRTNNTYRLSHTPGGSSGGPAAVIAASGSPLDLGSDTGGSIRVPAHSCGIAGLKPTARRVPRTGHAVPPGGPVDSFTQIGPMTRYVEDLALVLQLVVGTDGRYPAIVPFPVPDHAEVDVSALRGIFYRGTELWPPTPETVVRLQQAVDALSAVGVMVGERSPPGIEEAFEIHDGLLVADGGLGSSFSWNRPKLLSVKRPSVGRWTLTAHT